MASDRSHSRATSFWHPFSRMGWSRDNQIVFVRGQGCELEDSEGRRYLDATAALWYCMIGHGREEMARAIGAQAATLEACSCFDVYASDRTLELADAVAEIAPVDDPVVFLTSGGSDSVDTAAKVARRYWSEVGRPEKTVVLSREGSYHGMHAYGTSLAGIDANREQLGTLVDDAQVVAAHDATALAERIDALGPERVAAFFVEPVIGAGGVHPPVGDYLQAVRQVCDERDVLLVADEVVTGFGRTGHWFASERYGIRPDVLLIAKGVTSGYLPLGAAVFSGRVAAPFWDPNGSAWLRHGYTYSGHATACAAGLANLDILRREQLVERVAALEQPFAALVGGLTGVAGVSAVRTVGLTGAVQLDADQWPDLAAAGAAIVAECRERGLLTRMLAGHALQLSPPFVVTDAQLDQIVTTIAEGVAAVAGRAGPVPA